MNLSTRAATAAGFALTLMLSLNCNYASAQEAGYQTPSAAKASMAEAPAAPSLQGASCGTIGPQPETNTVVIPINTETANKVSISGDALMSGNFDGGLFLRNFSSDIDQFKGKIAEKAFSFLESIQNAGRKESAVVAPSGYSVVRQAAPSVSPAVF
ncbi:MAG: hypothetical protein JST89_22615 [Cyanobacteria bacterium SZAS-4]|nr:hypothetical protein [Cyanobacteria bacterium SZAS-4]